MFHSQQQFLLELRQCLERVADHEEIVNVNCDDDDIIVNSPIVSNQKFVLSCEGAPLN
jgi:hypothetical protein